MLKNDNNKEKINIKKDISINGSDNKNDTFKSKVDITKDELSKHIKEKHGNALWVGNKVFYDVSSGEFAKKSQVVVEIIDDNQLLYIASSWFKKVPDSASESVAMYFQLIESNIGSFVLHGNQIEFRAQLFFIENAISSKTLAELDEELIFLLLTHEKNIKSLIDNHFLNTSIKDKIFIKSRVCKSQVIDENKTCEIIKTYLEERKAERSKDNNISELFKGKNFENIAVLKGNDMTTIWSSLETTREYTKNNYKLSELIHYRIMYEISQTGILTIRAYSQESNFRIKEDAVYKIAKLFSELNSEDNYGLANVGYETYGINCYIQTSLIEGDISKVTLDYLTELVVDRLNYFSANVEAWSAGLAAFGYLRELDKRMKMKNDKLNEANNYIDRLLGNGDRPIKRDRSNPWEDDDLFDDFIFENPSRPRRPVNNPFKREFDKANERISIWDQKFNENRKKELDSSTDSKNTKNANGLDGAKAVAVPNAEEKDTTNNENVSERISMKDFVDTLKKKAE